MEESVMNGPLQIHNYQGLKISFRPDSADVQVLSHSFVDDIFFPAITDFKPTPSSVIIDVGAHIGTFSLQAIHTGKATKVIALEPNSESFSVLQRNVSQNNLSQSIIPLPLALSDKTGTSRLFLDKENWNHSLMEDTSKNFEDVKTISLSDLLLQQEIGRVDLIKFNCEGAEFKIVLSMDRQVLERVNMMLILFHEDMEKDFSRKDLIRHLREAGFLIRFAFQQEKRGWLIAKNRNQYSALTHWLFLTFQKITSTFRMTRQQFLYYAKRAIK